MPSRIAVVFCVIFLALAISPGRLHAQQAATVQSNVVSIPAASSGCNDDQCAAKAQVAIELPPGASVQTIHYYSNAAQNGSLSRLREVQPGESFSMKIEVVPQYASLAASVVEAHVLNRTQTRREFAMAVVYSATATASQPSDALVSTNVVEVPGTGAPCHDLSCAMKNRLAATLPAGSTVRKIHFYSNASADPYFDLSYMREVSEGDFGAAQFADTTTYTDAGNRTVVESTFANLSPGRARQAALVIDYSPGASAQNGVSTSGSDGVRLAEKTLPIRKD